MYSSNVGTLALCCLFLQGFPKVTGKSSSSMKSSTKSPVAIDAGLYTDPLFTYTVISVKNGKREDSSSSSYRLSVVMLVMGRERKLSRSRRGESKQKICEKRDKWRMTLMGCAEQNMYLENKDGRIL